ncbi:hypothetical protein LCGC14_0231800 [marine sediment metagenome]|uniref:Calcineurin-like phosphoesterase domain-containing protein n=1 Tax=marine sediment metagenome TaxID=412755 RepID=A0A0F9URD7_9ZZZZ
MLITGDLHLSSRARDDYRFELFPWLLKQCDKLNASTIILLGDLTDEKDKHSSYLVNRIMREICSLTDKEINLFLLKGNHDYVDQDNPFFRFVSSVPRVRFINKPEFHDLEYEELGWFLPHTSCPEEDWKDLDFENVEYVFLHQTISGAIASNGKQLEGTSEDIFKGVKSKIYSGDIHVPQKIGKIEYVGSPYQIRFGDNFEPRVIHIDEYGETHDIHFPTIKKHTVSIKDPEKLWDMKQLVEGDQVKVRMLLPRSSFVEWRSLKRRVEEICSEMGLDLYTVELEEMVRNKLKAKGEPKKSDRDMVISDPVDILKAYCEREEVGSDVLKAGLRLLGGGPGG